MCFIKTYVSLSKSKVYIRYCIMGTCVASHARYFPLALCVILTPSGHLPFFIFTIALFTITVLHVICHVTKNQWHWYLFVNSLTISSLLLYQLSKIIWFTGVALRCHFGSTSGDFTSKRCDLNALIRFVIILILIIICNINYY